MVVAEYNPAATIFFHFIKTHLKQNIKNSKPRFQVKKMNSTLLKKIFSSVFILFVSVSLFALPGVESKIADISGQFVYYKDSTFERESYFGIIYYDEGTYGLRYFAPAQTYVSPLKPKKDIFILFSLDSTKNYVELTGERILSAVTPDDTDIINYLHDMIYELTSRRQKAGQVNENLSVSQDFEQFGGTVTINFNPLIPIFNISNICDSTGKPVFNLITCGQLASSADENFSAFEGLPLKTQDNHTNFKLNKKSSKQKIEYKKTEQFTQKITLDSQWTAKAENFYTLSSNAILALDVIDFSNEDSGKKTKIIENLLRRFTLGTDGTYPYSELTSINSSKKSTIVKNLFFNDISKSFTRDFKILTQLDENHIALLSLTVFQETYSQNSKYFDSILKSYSAK